MGIIGWVRRRLGRPANARIVSKYIRCGKPGCHCNAGGDERHGPYLYRQWREHGKIRAQYLGKDESDQPR